MQNQEINNDKRKINEIYESEQKFRTIFNSANDAFIIANFEGEIVEVNPAACKTYQYNYNEMIGKNAMDLIHPDDHPKFGQFRKSVEKKGSYEGSTIDIRKDGTSFYTQVNGTVININKQPHLLAIVKDISKEKEAETKRENLLSNLKERIKEMECLYLVNESIRDPKIEAEEVLNKIVAYIPSGWPYPKKIFAEVLLDKKIYRAKNYKDSELFTSEKILIDNKERGHIKVNAVDWENEKTKNPFSSEKKDLLKAISIHIANYISRIEYLKNLKTTSKNLQRSNKELERFAYVASHDLQEPLRMVSSYTQLLERKYKDQLDERASKYIYYAVDGALRMQTLINDLLIYSRISTKGDKFVKTDIREIVNSAIKSLHLVIEETKAQISIDELPAIRVDKAQIERIFYNLINNAIKFRTENQNPKIHISAKEQNKSWLFSIKDNGIGIDKKFEEKVFTIFQRLHGGDKYKGTGIGLAICKRIVNRHGGEIWFESEGKGGTTFFFTIKK
ncbi:MAG: PAS domain S-box protein [Bacteroidetes bacterium]|nr:PAS domain S-box protein [Bacteroidota bacterium]